MRLKGCEDHKDRPRQDREGDKPFSAESDEMSEREEKGVKEAGGAGGGRIAWIELEGVPLSETLRVLGDQIEIGDLRHEVGVRHHQHRQDVERRDGEAHQSQRQSRSFGG